MVSSRQLQNMWIMQQVCCAPTTYVWGWLFGQPSSAPGTYDAVHAVHSMMVINA